MEEKILKYINENYSNDGVAIDINTELLTSGIIDSINTLTLVDFIESNFEVEFKAHEVGRQHMNTVAQIINLLEQKLNKS